MGLGRWMVGLGVIRRMESGYSALVEFYSHDYYLSC